MKPMHHTEYARALERLGFSNRGFCTWLGVAERAGRDWIAGNTRVPPAIAAFLRLAIAAKADAVKLREILGD